MVQGHGFGTEPPRTGSISRTEDAHGLSKTTWDFRLSGMHEDFSAGVGLVVLSRAPYAFRKSGRMEEEPFSRLTLAILFACARVDTCHPWNCMHSTSTHHPCTSSPCQKLRIKHKMHMSFWNNIKILFPGLSPLGLAPRLNT
jgi:hypothetical protein